VKNDTLIRIEGMKALLDKLGLVEAERFITLINQEPFDYTRWREGQFNDEDFDIVYAEAAALHEKNEKLKKAKAASRRAAVCKSTVPRRKVAKRLAHA